MQHRGIEYRLARRGDNEWQWTINAPSGTGRSGMIRGTRDYARTVASRAIDVWLLMNGGLPEAIDMASQDALGRERPH